MDYRFYWHPSVRLELLRFERVPAATQRAFGFVLAELYIADTEGYEMMSPPAFAALVEDSTYFAQRCGEVVVCGLYTEGRVCILHAALAKDAPAFDQAVAAGMGRVSEYVSTFRSAM